MKNPEIGQQTAEGIYIGQYNSLGKVFNMYAAPQNMGYPIAYSITREKLAKLKNWHGFEGTNYASAKEIEQALTDGSYKGGWIIPTDKMLNENVALIKKALMKADQHNTWYWSSTPHDMFKGNIYAKRFEDGYAVFEASYGAMNCRPVRLVPVN